VFSFLVKLATLPNITDGLDLINVKASMDKRASIELRFDLVWSVQHHDDNFVVNFLNPVFSSFFASSRLLVGENGTFFGILCLLIYMKCLSCNLYLMIILISSLSMCGFFYSSLSNTSLMQPKTCLMSPKIYFQPATSQVAIDLIHGSIINAKERVVVAYSEYPVNLFITDFLPVLKKSNAPKENIQVILPKNDKLAQALAAINITSYYGIRSVKNQPTFYYIIADNSVFVAPFLALPHLHGTTSQILHFHDCNVAADDVIGFLQYYIHVENEDAPRIIPSSLQAKTSAILPGKIGNTSFFFFHNPDDYVSPLRINTKDVLEAAFAEEPEEMLFYTQYPPLLTSYQWHTMTGFSLYFQTKAALYRNKTKIKFLVSNLTITSENIDIWCRAFSSFSKFEVRLYSYSDFGPHYLLSNTRSYAFTHPIRTHDINEYVSLHYATDDQKVYNELRQYYFEVWARSSPFPRNS